MATTHPRRSGAQVLIDQLRIHGADTILTTARAIGRENGVRVRIGDSDPIEAEMVGWDPATGIAVLRCGTSHRTSVGHDPRAREPLGAGGHTP